jgi:hypothetical protein
MRAYFFRPLISTKELDTQYQRIVDILKKSGLFVVASSDENNADFKKEELEQMNASGEILMDKMDCVIIEASKPDQEIGYLLAYAISQKKPLLYLYQRGTPERVAYGYLTKKNIPEFIQMKSYTSADLEEQIMEFVNSIGVGVKEKPTIKFTLRLTPRMERYLASRAKRAKVNKADYLREIVEEMMKKNDHYEE